VIDDFFRSGTMSLKVVLLALMVALAPSPASTHEITSGDLVIVHPMVDEAEKGQAESRGSMEIRNEGNSPDRLLSIKSEFADAVTIEGSAPVTVPAKGRAPVLMRFKNIKRKLSEDEAYAGELMFEKAGTVKVDLMVHTHAR
jgi:periplasmic copper chaperone A